MPKVYGKQIPRSLAILMFGRIMYVEIIYSLVFFAYAKENSVRLVDHGGMFMSSQICSQCWGNAITDVPGFNSESRTHKLGNLSGFILVIAIIVAIFIITI